LPDTRLAEHVLRLRSSINSSELSERAKFTLSPKGA
jgi:hypothetical protein